MVMLWYIHSQMCVNVTSVKSLTYGTKNQTTGTLNPATDSGCCSASVFAARRIIYLVGNNCKSCGCNEGAIYWHFKNKSDLFNEIWELSDASISDLEIEYRAKFPNDPLSVIREILVYVLEATVTEERRRLMMEIIYHKCEFVGEMTVVQQAQRQLSLASYERIEQTLKECIAAKLLPANLLTRRAAVLMRSYLSGLMENWLFAPDSFDLHAEARDYVAILLEMYQFCPTLRGPESLSA